MEWKRSAPVPAVASREQTLRAQAEVLKPTQGHTLLLWLVPQPGTRLDNDLCFGGEPM